MKGGLEEDASWMEWEFRFDTLAYDSRWGLNYVCFLSFLFVHRQMRC